MGKRKTIKQAKERPGWKARVAERLFQTITGQVVLGIGALTIIIGAWIAFDGYVAKAADLRVVDARLDQWKTLDDLSKVQQRLWKYTDRYGKECERAEQVVRDECRTLREQWKRLEEKLKKYDPQPEPKN
jgi:hypothetical protein